MIKAYARYNIGTDEPDLFLRISSFLNNPNREGLLINLIELLDKEVVAFNKDEKNINQPAPVVSGSELLQAIVNAAWEYGIRPAGFRDIKNETRALENHLIDMRTIAFGHLKFGVPEQEKRK